MHANIKLQDKATLVILNCAFSWGNMLDKEITNEIAADKHSARGAVRAHKTLLPGASGVHVKEVQAHLSAFYQYHASKTFATPIRGQRLMPATFWMEYMEKFGEAQASTDAAMDTLVAGYPAAVISAKALLIDAYNEADYPPAEEIRRYLKLDVHFLPVPSGDHILNALGTGVAADVDAFVTDVMQVAAEDAKKRLRDAVERMARQLSKKEAKIFDTMPEAIDELVKTLPAIAGLTDDVELRTLIDEVRATLGGYTGDDFRNNEATRTGVGAAAADLIKRMGG